MKTIEQLLQLAKNPYYVFTEAERMVLDDFLSPKPDTASPISRKAPSKKSSAKTRVTVRNIVKKVDTYAPEDNAA